MIEGEAADVENVRAAAAWPRGARPQTWKRSGGTTCLTLLV